MAVKKKTESNSTPMSMLDAMMGIADSGDFGRDTVNYTHRTFSPMFDYLNGSAGTDLDGNLEMMLGFEGGKSILVAGDTGCGKSTWCIQHACHLVKKYADVGSTFHILDYEASNSPKRVLQVSGMDRDMFKKHVRIKVGVYAESLLELVYTMAKKKIMNRDLWEVECRDGSTDEFGNPMKILPPTVILVDSIPAMKSSDYGLVLKAEKEGSKKKDEEIKMGGLTAGGRNAIVNKEILGRCLQPCIEANIIIMQIAHVNVNMALGGVPTKTNPFLEAGKAISGGRAVQYYANLIVEMKAGSRIDDDPKSKDYAYGGAVRGLKVSTKIIKSRNSEAGFSIIEVFDLRSGFNPRLSALESLIIDGGIDVSGSYLSIPNYEGKFQRGTFMKMIEEKPEFAKAFDEHVETYLRENIRLSGKLQINVDATLAKEWESKSDAEKIELYNDTVGKTKEKLEKLEASMDKHNKEVMEKGDTGESVLDQYEVASDEILEDASN